MMKLKPIGIDDKHLFHQIAMKKTIRNRKKMLSAENYIFERYDYYLDHTDALDQIDSEEVISDEVASLLRESYKSSRLFSRVRKDIMDTLPKGMKGKCPFCMISEPNTLEHYFPESKYPEYILFTPNLVPCCSQCNTNKNDIIKINGERQFIHFYYDELPTEQYLYADIQIQDNIPVVGFWISLDNTKEIHVVIKNHYQRLKLFKRYIDQCNSLISTFSSEFYPMWQEGADIETCINLVQYKINALRKNRGKNDWEACVLEACIRNPQIFEKILLCAS